MALVLLCVARFTNVSVPTSFISASTGNCREHCEQHRTPKLYSVLTLTSWTWCYICRTSAVRQVQKKRLWMDFPLQSPLVPSSGLWSEVPCVRGPWVMVAAGQVLGPQRRAHRGVVSRNRDCPALLSGARTGAAFLEARPLWAHTQHHSMFGGRAGNPGHGCLTLTRSKPEAVWSMASAWRSGW